MSREKLLFIETFGCQMNELDSELVVGALRRRGFRLTEERDRADLVLFNTCAVREHAEDKVWSRLGQLKAVKRRRPDLLVGVLGCMANEWRERILRRAPHVDLVVGTRDFGEIGRFVEEIERDRAPIVAADLTRPVDVERDIALRPERHSAFVTVMRGCDFTCGYCIVPSTRGAEVSRPVEEVREEVRRLAEDGVREVTLLGQTVDGYGKGLVWNGRRPDLGDLLEAIHDAPGLERIRFVTSHPSLMREPILRRVRDLPKVCEYLHMPAQSGSDDVLRRMRRGYTVARYLEIVERAREIVPGVEVASDFIVGFPGETEADFEASERLVRRVGFSQCYIFKYSPRPGTRAADLEDDVPDEAKRERNERLLAAQEEVQRRKNAAEIGREVEVLCEGRSRGDARRLAGRTRQNRIVVFEGEEAELVGALARVTITDATPLALYGSLPGRPPLRARARDAVLGEATWVPPTAGAAKGGASEVEAGPRTAHDATEGRRHGPPAEGGEDEVCVHNSSENKHLRPLPLVR
jgi:tRNA-2-methylthio-N6-dimethylallyladenosine synthase